MYHLMHSHQGGDMDKKVTIWNANPTKSPTIIKGDHQSSIKLVKN